MLHFAESQPRCSPMTAADKTKPILPYVVGSSVTDKSIDTARYKAP